MKLTRSVLTVDDLLRICASIYTICCMMSTFVLLGDHPTREFDRERYDNNAFIVDAMALIQSMKNKWETFGELCNAIFKNVLKLAQQWKSTRVNFVADRYPPISIKQSERSKRSENTGVQKVRVFNKDQHIPKQWKKFLALGENKESLIQFLCEHWRSYESSCLGHLSALYVTSKEKCYCFTQARYEEEQIDCSEVSDLETNHEEADTRLLLHANQAKETNDRIIIKSPDTDVFVLSIAMQRTIEKETFFMTGTGNKFRLIPIMSIVEETDENLCQCLLGFHAFSGTYVMLIFIVLSFRGYDH